MKSASTLFLIGVIPYAVSFQSVADQVIFEDLIVAESLCVGAACADGEEFDFDTIRLKGANPQIHFQDTSNSASFPTNDWRMGYDGDSNTFYVLDVDADKKVLQLEGGANGGIALGAAATVAADAVSVGALGSERKIIHVADGTDDNDAVTVQQFNAFKTQAEQGIDGEYAAINGRIDALATRLEVLAERVNQLAP